MIISDKQDLKKCVKKIVRHAAVSDTHLVFNPTTDDVGIDALLSNVPGGRRLLDEQGTEETLLSHDALSMYSALDALGLSVQHLEEARTLQESYSREGWIREILDIAPVRKVFIEFPFSQSVPAELSDDRFVPLVRIRPESVRITKYGINWKSEAEQIFEYAGTLGTRHLMVQGYHEQLLSYCVLPLCEDQGMILHLWFDSGKEIDRFIRLAQAFPSVRCILHAASQEEGHLIDAVPPSTRMMTVISNPNHYRDALAALGLSFLPFCSDEKMPEQMLGRWIINREYLIDALTDHYLILARAGYELTTERIERDIDRMLTVNLDAFCE